jgi:hypothetical protein
MPILLSRPWQIFGIDFSNTGQIGDTIGGLTAPFLNFFAAILIYKSFKEQVTANKIIQEEIRKSQKDKHYDSLLKESEKIEKDFHSFIFPIKGGENQNGFLLLYRFSDFFNQNYNKNYHEMENPNNEFRPYLMIIIQHISNLLNLIDRYKILEKDDPYLRTLLHNKIKSIYDLVWSGLRDFFNRKYCQIQPNDKELYLLYELLSKLFSQSGFLAKYFNESFSEGFKKI